MVSKPQNGRGRYVVKRTCLPAGHYLVRKLRREFGMAMSKKRGNSPDMRKKVNRPKTGAGSKGGAATRRRPRGK